MTNPFDQKLQDLESRAEELIVKYNNLFTANKALHISCKSLEDEKKMMQSKHERWLVERARLTQCNELATAKLQSVLVRLKSIESLA